MNNRKFEGIWFPAHIWLDKNLSLFEKFMLLEINSLDNEEGCFAQNKHFAELSGKSPNWCSEIINELKNKELISIKYEYKGKEIKKRIMKITEKGSRYINDPFGKTVYPLRKNRKVDNNNSTIINNSIEENQDFPINEFIEYWNKHEEVRKHKSPKTKIYNKTSKYFNYLLKGTFGKHCPVDKSFMGKHNISLKLLRAKFSKQDIYSALDNLIDYHKSGYWPGINPDGDLKTKSNPNLCDLIFNSDTGTSIFLWVMTEKPERIGHKFEDKYPDITEVYCNFFYPNLLLKKCEKKSVAKKVNKLMEFYNNMQKNIGKYYSHTSFSSYFGRPMLFVNQHISWLGKFNKSSSSVDPDNNSFNFFLDYVKKNFGYILDPNELEKRRIMKDWKQANQRINARSN